MEHGAHPNPNLQDDPKTSPLVLGGIIGTVLVAVTVVAVSALYFRNEHRVVREVVYENDPAKMTVNRLHGQQRQILAGGVRWVDKAKGQVGLPIDQAISLVVAEGGKLPARVLPAASQPAAKP